MPYDILMEGKGYFVVKKGSKEKMNKKPHMSRKEALAHMRALYAAEDGGAAMGKEMKKRKMMG